MKEKLKEKLQYIEVLAYGLKMNRFKKVTKVFATITIMYALSPIDLVPDFIPILGYIDDLVILPLLVVITLKTIDKNYLESLKMEVTENEYKINKKWVYGLPIIFSWIVVIILIFYWVLY